MNPAQPADAAAGQESHEHRLGLIVFLMGGGDEGNGGVVRASGAPFGKRAGGAHHSISNLEELRVANLARCRFDSAMLYALLVEGAVRDTQLDFDRCAQLAHELFVVIRLCST